MTKYKATCYPSVESFDMECEAESFEEAKEEFQDISNTNYGFIVCNSDIKEVFKMKNKIYTHKMRGEEKWKQNR